MKLLLGSDHIGFAAKEQLLLYLTEHGYEAEDVGNKVMDPADQYAEFAFTAVTRLLGEPDETVGAVLLGGDGQGMCMAANRVHGIRAAVAWDEQSAREAKAGSNANVLWLPVDRIEQAAMAGVIQAWLGAQFETTLARQQQLQTLDEL